MSEPLQGCANQKNSANVPQCGIKYQPIINKRQKNFKAFIDMGLEQEGRHFSGAGNLPGIQMVFIR